MAGGEESFGATDTEAELPSPASQTIDRGEEAAPAFEFDLESTPGAELEQASIAFESNPKMAPTTPKFGGTYPGDAVWIGGPPKEDWSGSTLSQPKTPLCIRGLEAGSEIKGYLKRTEGHPTKFKRDDKEFTLLAFAAEALKHMQRHGMDTVFYLKGANSAGEGAEELFTFHSKFTKSHVDKHISDMTDGVSPKFDEYCSKALSDSAEWLEASLDESLKSSLRLSLSTAPTGPQLWMLIVSEVQSTSIRRSDQMAKKFQALKLSSFKGENVRDYCDEAQDLLIQLERDDQLPKNHLLDIVDAFTECTVLDFQVFWIGKRSSVESFVQETAGKDKSAVASMPNRIHFNDLLETARQSYTNLLHKWGPNKGLPSQEASLVAEVKAMKAAVTQLKQQLNPASGGGGGSNRGNNGNNGKRRCYDCQSDTHLRGSPQCPKFQAKTDGSKPPPNGDTPPAGQGKWRAPKEGEPHTKEINGTTFHWCQKCRRGNGRWTKDHLTEAHKEGFMKEKNKAKKEGGASGGSGGGGPAGHQAAAGSDLLCQWIGSK